jgi:hypothetical protein
VVSSPDQCAQYENYAGAEPVGYAALCLGITELQPGPDALLGPTDTGFAQDTGFVSDNFVSFTLNNFPGQTALGANTMTLFGYDFDPTGTTLYALDNTGLQLGTINLTNGAVTLIGSQTTTPLLIDISMNASGTLYGHDISTDAIYPINPATGAATLVGPTGFAANFAQGMDFDNEDGTLYIFLYQGGGANVYGTVNLSTGAVTPLATNNPLGEFEGATQTTASGEPPVLPASAHLPVPVFSSGAPAIDVSPDSLESSQAPDQVVNKTLTISNVGTGTLEWSIFEDQTSASLVQFWSDNFDAYPTGQDLHGVGGWKGWDNTPGGTAFTTDVQALSAPNSVDIVGAADLVHEYAEYAGANSGQWTYTAWQYAPSSMTGQSYFILLNTYADGGPNNWSVQVLFDGDANQVINTGVSGGILSLGEDQWVEIRVEIDLNANTQSFFYNNTLLYAGTWTEEVSGAGALNIAAVDLFANNATSVYYDDMMLDTEEPPPAEVCDFATDITWASVSPTSGSTSGGESDDVTVAFNSTGLSASVYTGTLCVQSNDASNPLVEVPLTLNVGDQGTPTIDVSPDSLSSTQASDTQVTLPLNISNVGDGDLAWSITEDAAEATPSGTTGSVANPGLATSGTGTGGGFVAAYRGAGVLLYDQTSNPGTQGVTSVSFQKTGGNFRSLC